MRRYMVVWQVLLMVVLYFDCNGQEETDYIPDGTTGEQLEVLDSTNVPIKWRDKRWRLFPGKISTLKLGGGFLYEYAGYIQDANSRQQMDSLGTPLEPAFKVRDFRVVMSGQFKRRPNLTWKAGFMYDGATREWLVRETGVMVKVPELFSHFFIGRTKEGFSMNKVMNGYSGWGMERQVVLDVIPILADGVKWLGFLPKQRIFWNVGVFADWLSSNQSFSTYSWQFVTRTGWLPVYSPEDSKVFHIGLNYRYGETENGSIQARSRPEANPAPYFLTTGTFQSPRSNHWGYEVYYSSGSWMMGSEFYIHQFDAQQVNNPVFYGGEVMISYLFTGESRAYQTATSIYGFVPVARPVFKGGPGALEGVIRVTSLDLNDGLITGGTFWRITPMVNWYLTKDIRLELTYGYAELNRFSLIGATQFFQTRIQFTLL